MSFSNAKGFNIHGGTFTSVQGDQHIHVHSHRDGIDANHNEWFALQGLTTPPSTLVTGPPSLHCIENRGGHHWEEDSIEIISRRELHLIHELGSGPGYFLHAGKYKDRAVIVKIFNAGPNSSTRLESTMTLSRNLMHPNLLQIEGVSSPASSLHFLAYQHGKSAAAPLAAALKEDVSISVTLGFKLIAGLSVRLIQCLDLNRNSQRSKLALNYLRAQRISPSTIGIENFDVVVNHENQFLICFNPSTLPHPPEMHQGYDDDEESWKILNGLCDKVLKDANYSVHDEVIDRDASPLDSLGRSPIHTVFSGPVIPVQTAQDNLEAISIPPRREYVWRTIPRGTQSLASLARRFASGLKQEPRSDLRRLVWTDTQNVHRCAGYIREEITLAVARRDSAVVSHSVPSLSEICSVCHEVVHSDEVFQCICGDPNPCLGSTTQCKRCKTWSHSACVRSSSKHFICDHCVPLPPTTPPPSKELSRQEIIAAQHESTRANQRTILSACTNSSRGVDVLLPGNAMIRSARYAAEDNMRYSYLQPDGEAYDISDIMEEEWRDSNNKNDLLEGVFGRNKDRIGEKLDRVLNKVQSGLSR